MKLYYFPVAPNPTKVCLYLAEKGIEVEKVLVDLRKGEQSSPEHLARNPFGSLPVLELDDGTHLTESLSIIEFFEDLHPTPTMIGDDAAERARVRSLERIADVGVLMTISALVHATKSPVGIPADPPVAEYFRKRLPKSLQVLDARIADHAFVAGDRPTIADCTLYAALSFGGFFGIVLDPQYTNLTRWFEAFAGRPSVTTVNS